MRDRWKGNIFFDNGVLKVVSYYWSAIFIYKKSIIFKIMHISNIYFKMLAKCIIHWYRCFHYFWGQTLYRQRRISKSLSMRTSIQKVLSLKNGRPWTGKTILVSINVSIYWSPQVCSLHTPTLFRSVYLTESTETLSLNFSKYICFSHEISDLLLILYLVSFFCVGPKIFLSTVFSVTRNWFTVIIVLYIFYVADPH